MLAVDPPMLWGTDEVCVDVIHGIGLGQSEVWMDILLKMVLVDGCSGERLRSWWTLPWFGPWTLWRTDEA